MQKKELFIQYLYIQFYGNYNVTSSAWKCFRCDLIFKEEVHAKVHQDISKHSVRTVKVITA